jgi:hypothetical protein
MMTAQARITEPCTICGEETAVGSALYWDRHVRRQPDGMVVYRCEECEERTQAVQEDPAPEQTSDNWLVAAVTGNDVRQNW